ncbi:hypothetical protein AAG570_005683 [Ranatra chinensis]|uniref:Uncharacterized protein n=1 Tax=Ranatra chinensis TaxID=642074 RepID=A0ABD0YD53_9HEMI
MGPQKLSCLLNAAQPLERPAAADPTQELEEAVRGGQDGVPDFGLQAPLQDGRLQTGNLEGNGPGRSRRTVGGGVPEEWGHRSAWGLPGRLSVSHRPAGQFARSTTPLRADMPFSATTTSDAGFTRPAMPKIFLIKNRLLQQQLKLLENQKSREELSPPGSPLAEPQPLSLIVKGNQVHREYYMSGCPTDSLCVLTSPTTVPPEVVPMWGGHPSVPGLTDIGHSGDIRPAGLRCCATPKNMALDTLLNALREEGSFFPRCSAGGLSSTTFSRGGSLFHQVLPPHPSAKCPTLRQSDDASWRVRTRARYATPIPQQLSVCPGAVVCRVHQEYVEACRPSPGIPGTAAKPPGTCPESFATARDPLFPPQPGPHCPACRTP